MRLRFLRHGHIALTIHSRGTKIFPILLPLTQALDFTNQGETVNYEELVALWKSQRNQYQEWELKLLRSPEFLRGSVEKVLSPPNAAWKEFKTNVPYRYVEIVDFYGRDKPMRRDPRDEAIRPDGILVFGIGVTFDHGIDSYPKQEIFIPVAARFTLSGPEFTLFNRDEDAPEQNWTKSTEEFSKKLIDRYKDYLSHDPHTGFGNKTRMGFL